MTSISMASIIAVVPHLNKQDNEEKSSVGDPDQEDPHVFGPSGSVSQRYGSGSFPFLIKMLRGLEYACKIKL